MNPCDKERIGEAREAADDAEEEAARLRTELEEAKAAITLLREAIKGCLPPVDSTWLDCHSRAYKALEATKEYDDNGLNTGTRPAV